MPIRPAMHRSARPARWGMRRQPNRARREHCPAPPRQVLPQRTRARLQPGRLWKPGRSRPERAWAPERRRLERTRLGPPSWPGVRRVEEPGPPGSAGPRLPAGSQYWLPTNWSCRRLGRRWLGGVPFGLGGLGCRWWSRPRLGGGLLRRSVRVGGVGPSLRASPASRPRRCLPHESAQPRQSRLPGSGGARPGPRRPRSARTPRHSAPLTGSPGRGAAEAGPPRTASGPDRSR